MSTTLIGIILPKIVSYSCSLKSVNSRNPVDDLGDFVQRVMSDKGLSTLEVESRSKRGGREGISDAYVTRIKNKQVKNPSYAKLIALARGLDVTEDEVLAIAHGKKPNTSAIADSRFEILSLKFKSYKGEKKTRAQTLIDMVEREFERMDSESE